MEVFWGRRSTRGTLGAPLEALLERDADFTLFLGTFREALGDPLAALGTPGDPTLAIFRLRGSHFAASERHPRQHAKKKNLRLGGFEVSKSEVFAGCR